MTSKKKKSVLNTVASLKLILDVGGSIRPREFAEKRWAGSPNWENARRCGDKGSSKGMGMWCSAGCYLGILARKGLLIKSGKTYSVTEEGMKFIKENLPADSETPSVVPETKELL